eukprot:symbB.v1.2.040193.t1/scaffold7063.1/size13523/1
MAAERFGIELKVMMQLRLGELGTKGPAAVIAQAWPDALVLENSLRSAGLGSVELRNAALKNWLRTTSWQAAQRIFSRHESFLSVETCWDDDLGLEVSAGMLRAVAYAADAAKEPKAWPLILEVVRSFREFQLLPDPHLWNLAMRKCSGNPLALLHELRQRGIKSYSAALGAMAKTWSWQTCYSLMCEMSQRSLQVTLGSLGASDGSSESLASWRMALELRRWSSCGWEPSAAVAAGLEMKSSSRTWEAQIECLEKLRRLGHSGGSADPY